MRWRRPCSCRECAASPTVRGSNHALFFYNPNSGLKAFNSFNTASLTHASVPAFTYQSSFAQVWQPNSALMSRVAFVQIKLYF